MHVNLIVALIRSNQFEQARKEWERIVSSGTSDHYTLKGIGAYFLLRYTASLCNMFRDKKYEEALNQVKGKDTYSVFLRAQIHLAKSKSFFIITLFRGR